MKKVLFVVTKSNWGGAQRYVYDLAVEAQKEGFQTAVVTGGRGPLLEKLSEAGIKTIALPEMQQHSRFVSVIFSLKNFFIPFFLLRIFLQEKPDIIHLNSFKVGGLGALAGWGYKIATFNHKPKIVFTAHGWAFMEKRSPIPRAIIFFIAWVSSLLHQCVIVINNKDHVLAKKFISRKKISLIYNGIRTQDFLSRKEARKFFSGYFSEPLQDDTFLVGTIAELTPNKGLTHLLHALSLSSSSSARVVIIGEGEERKIMERNIAARNLDGKVALVGFVPDAAQYLKGVDLFVLPSLKEGLPYAIMETMVAGTPVVATNVGGIPDLITHNQTGVLVPPADPAALAKALAVLEEKRGLRDLFSRSAQEKINANFSLKRMTERTFAVYEA